MCFVSFEGRCTGGCIVFLRGRSASPPAPLHSWRGEVDVFAVAQEVVAYSAHAGLSDVLVWKMGALVATGFNPWIKGKDQRL